MTIKQTSMAVMMALSGVLLADVGMADVRVQSQGEVKYVNGGFGLEDREAMRAQAKDFNLNLSFSEGARGTFVADVKLFITDKTGDTVLKLDHAGPLTHVRLAAGRYQVVAEYNNRTIRKSVTLDSKGAGWLYFNWPVQEEDR